MSEKTRRDKTLKLIEDGDDDDWKTAVFILPSICAARNLAASRFGRLPYYYFLLLPTPQMFGLYDWNTAVLLLPSALRLSSMRHD